MVKKVKCYNGVWCVYFVCLKFWCLMGRSREEVKFSDISVFGVVQNMGVYDGFFV